MRTGPLSSAVGSEKLLMANRGAGGQIGPCQPTARRCCASPPPQQGFWCKARSTLLTRRFSGLPKRKRLFFKKENVFNSPLKRSRIGFGKPQDQVGFHSVQQSITLSPWETLRQWLANYGRVCKSLTACSHPHYKQHQVVPFNSARVGLSHLRFTVAHLFLLSLLSLFGTNNLKSPRT